MDTAHSVVVRADDLGPHHHGRIIGGPGRRAVIVDVHQAKGGIRLRARLLLSQQIIELHLPACTTVTIQGGA